jgi:hypothetical protein
VCFADGLHKILRAQSMFIVERRRSSRTTHPRKLLFLQPLSSLVILASMAVSQLATHPVGYSVDQQAS